MAGFGEDTPLRAGLAGIDRGVEPDIAAAMADLPGASSFVEGRAAFPLCLMSLWVPEVRRVLLALFSDSGPDEDDDRLMAWLDFSNCKSCFVGLFHKDCAGCGRR